MKSFVRLGGGRVPVRSRQTLRKNSSSEDKSEGVMCSFLNLLKTILYILIKYKNSKEDKKFTKGKELPESIKIIYKELDSLEKISI